MKKLRTDSYPLNDARKMFEAFGKAVQANARATTLMLEAAMRLNNVTRVREQISDKIQPPRLDRLGAKVSRYEPSPTKPGAGKRKRQW